MTTKQQSFRASALDFVQKNWLSLLAVALLAWNLVMLRNLSGGLTAIDSRISSLEVSASDSMRFAVRKAMDEEVLELAQAALEARESKASAKAIKSAKQKRG